MSKVLLLLAAIALAWITQDYWLPHATGSLKQEQTSEQTPPSLEDYSHR